MPTAEIGVIGGSGLYQMDGLSHKKEVKLKTPFGTPSDSYVLGNLEGRKVAFLSRHGRGHRFLPSEINYRANIWGMKALDVKRIISVSAVGSMKEKLKPGHIVLPDQFYDHTRRRIGTFFGNGVVAHISLAQPICPELRQVLLRAGRGTGAVIHDGGGLFLHRGTSVFSPWRIPDLSAVGGGCDRDDQCDRGQAGERSRNLLFHTCLGNRLRLLAPGNGICYRRGCS